MDAGTAAALNVATAGAGFNLASAITNFANPAGAIAGYTKDLYGWLQRSGIDEANFSRCMTAAQGLAYPNKNGLTLPASVTHADDRLQKLKQGQLLLGVAFSQALGRLIVKDPEVCYMATTTACLLTHHDPAYIKLALTAMILDKGGHETETIYNHEVWRAPIKAVISKVVDSIFFNISNPGHTTVALPSALAKLHVHPVDDINFAAIIMQIQKANNNLVLNADRFPGDVVLWLINHFEGYLDVYVKSARLYGAKLGHHTRTITVIISETCSEDDTMCNDRAWPVILGEVIEGQTHRLVGGSTSEAMKPCSYQRQKLYKTENLINTTWTSFKAHLNFEQQNEVQHVARRITKWLMHVPTDLKDWPQLSGYCFRSELEVDEDRDRSRDVIVAQYLSRSPRILQESTGESANPAPIFRRPTWQGSPIGSQNTDPEEWGTNATPEEVFKNFPSAVGMLQNMQKGCRCPNCRSEGSLSNSKLGCLRYLAVLELCILVSHAVADALGAEDVSGAPCPDDAMSGVTALLSEIIDQEKIGWNTWFQVAACAVTGCPRSYFVDANDAPANGGECSWVAVQYGSLSVLAPWLDFSMPLEICGSFKMNMVEGSIQGVKGDIALIHTEQAPADHDDSPSQMDDCRDSGRSLSDTDATPFEIQKALFPDELSYLYKLLVILKVDDCLRLLDPTRLMMSLSRSEQAICKHPRPHQNLDSLAENLGLSHTVNACTLQDMVLHSFSNRDSDLENYRMRSLDVSLVLDDIRKLHIILALTRSRFMLRDCQRCCLPCAVQRSLQFSDQPGGLHALLNFDRLTRKQIQGMADHRP